MKKLLAFFLLLSGTISGPECISQGSPAPTPPRIEVDNNMVYLRYGITHSKPSDKFLVWVDITDTLGNIIHPRLLSGDIGDDVSGGMGKEIRWDISMEPNPDDIPPLLFKMYIHPILEEEKDKPAAQEKRLALVIGNSTYQYGMALRNPVNDARAIEQALTKLGFDVLAHYDLEQSDFKRAIDEFGMKLKDYDVALFYYAGHGIQAFGENYLIPVDANIQSEQQVEYDCVRADRALAQMDAAGSEVNIMILDACRNNPFERSWTRSAYGKGLAFMDAPSGTLIAYATAPGSTAADGTGDHGMYTEALLESIHISQATILQMFQRVRFLVVNRSGKRQTPWESTSLIGDFYFSSDY